MGAHYKKAIVGWVENTGKVFLWRAPVVWRRCFCSHFRMQRWGHFTDAASGGRSVLLKSVSLSLVLASSSLSVITAQTSPSPRSAHLCFPELKVAPNLSACTVTHWYFPFGLGPDRQRGSLRTCQGEAFLPSSLLCSAVHSWGHRKHRCVA